MKIAIDLGHGVGSDRGAVGIVTEESIINAVGNLVINKLKTLGHTVIELRPSYALTVNDSLYKRYSKSNNNECDWCISIHANCGGGKGTEIFTYGAKEITEARTILNNIVSFGFRNRGIKDGSRLAMIRRTEAKAMLIEICFCDTSDVDIYNSVGSELIANAIVSGLTGQTLQIKKYKIGWSKDDIGWYYSYNGERCYYNQWKEIDGEWYSFDSDGYARRSVWIKDKGYWYYLKDNCNMARDEWLWIQGKCYYFGEQGGLYISTFTPDGYKVNEKGEWIE